MSRGPLCARVCATTETGSQVYGPRPSRPENVPVGKSCIQPGASPAWEAGSATEKTDFRKGLLMDGLYEKNKNEHTLNVFQ
jgi:hypothetical protein